MRAALLGLGAIAIASGLLTYLVAEDSRWWVGNLSWTASAIVAVLGVAQAVRRSRPSERTAWALLLAACIAWLVGELLFFYFTVTTFPASPNVADACWVLFAFLVIAAGGSLGQRSGGGRYMRLLETTPLVVALCALIAALLWARIEASDLTVEAKATALAFPLVYVAAALLMLQVGVSGSVRIQGNRGMALLLAGLMLEAVAFILWSPQLLEGSYVVGHDPVDLLWTAGMVLIGFGAWWSGPIEPEADPQATHRRRGGILPSLIFAVLAVYQVAYSAADHPAGAKLALAVGVLVVGTMLVARAALVRRRENALYVRLRGRERELAAAHEELRSILDSAGEGIYGLDRDGLCTFVNPAASRMTGHDPEHLIGRSLHAVIHHTREDGSPYPVEECPIVHALVDGETHAGEDLYWRADGTSFPVSYTSMPIVREGEVTGGVVVFGDISERREIERRKDEFTAVVSHELRTPLTSIRGSLGLMAGGALGVMPPKAQRMLEIAVQNTDRLVRLINDILDIERIESGRVEMQLTEVQSRELVERAVEGVGGMASEAGVPIEWEVEPCAVWGDPDRLIQTLTNLLSNAIKFSPAGVPVRVEARREGRDVAFAVSDRGRGIPRDKLVAIFGRFEQVDASDARDRGGTGLGLAIARSIVLQHGGRIWVESQLGAGSTFRFRIPAAVTSAGAPDAPDERLTVAVCDDDADIREVMMATLQAHGYQVIPAASGEHMLEILDREQPRVIVLDLMMEGLSGWKTAELIEQRLAGLHVPLVIATVLPREQAGPLAQRADAFLQKPLDPGALVAAVDGVLRRQDPLVLLVEDDEQLASVLCEGLERRGLEVCVARTGHEAIERAQRLAPGVLVLDIGLPGRDGFQVVEALRREEDLRGVPVIVYTARELEGPERERLNLGSGVEYLVKSRVPAGELERHVCEAARRRATHSSRKGRT